ncbi:tyrosine recombinase XerS [Brevibacillus reuszeri]|uniref:tyrosine recombinase XerS n=1 Tax=Brevibacillus reuszeri TaxID=54915 RepID=UPI0013E0CC33|nr:tyrosine recombinase XerS [Brevibacillus reuszeri]
MGSFLDEKNKETKEKVRKQLVLFPDYVGRYMLHIWRKSSGQTLLNYLGDYKIFFKWLVQEGHFSGELKDIPLSILNDLSLDDVNFYLSYLDDNYKKSSANRRLSSLKSLFRYLSDLAENQDGSPLLHRNVMAKVDLHKIEETAKSKADKIANKILVKTDEYDEQKEFLEFIYEGYLSFCKDKRDITMHLKNRDRDTAFISLVLATGLRAFEVEALDLEHISMKNNTVRVIGKGGLEDILYFGDTAKTDLERYLSVRVSNYKVVEEENALFVSFSTRTGKPGRLNKSSLQKIVKKYSIAFEKNSMSIHKLRHSFITRFHSISRDIAVTQQAARHKNPATTQIYNHISQEMIKEAFRKANE